ncbi:50S ribosomal protein L6 [Alkalitalea saponilacus]|uniref:Large ribosomal subunit protein uL6 n=1 Tax=Alkalitalea saponilacus TaxID=889453 RepID=A0A1T5HQ35_9BACT|nr:50S ribosomal protein L6 [Alkalitalea saponilacus]ASB48465.1 50S ribosomal protein L6 [Alkalitalea saponilacus]SKC22815.1 large subunit ribosomal protein L6 [Alkalitalea saponilacus]
MSRIGKAPISIPAGVNVTVKDNLVTVKGPKGELQQEIHPEMKVEINDGVLSVERPSEEKSFKSLHGLYRSLINNMVVGVSEGYQKKLELVGVGYRAASTGQILELSLGYSHAIHIQLPKEIKVEAVTDRKSNPIITLESIDKQLLGQVCAKIRSLRKPEPYKGKGIRFVGEVIRRKAGKSAKV